MLAPFDLVGRSLVVDPNPSAESDTTSEVGEDD